MDSAKYIGMDTHKEAISIAVLNASRKLVMEWTTGPRVIRAFPGDTDSSSTGWLQYAREPA